MRDNLKNGGNIDRKSRFVTAQGFLKALDFRRAQALIHMWILFGKATHGYQQHSRAKFRLIVTEN